MNYTLFVDESGDFERFERRSGWVISGVLCAGKRGPAEARMKAAMEGVAVNAGLRGPKGVHMTEVRDQWRDPVRVTAFGENVLEAAHASGAAFFAVINRSGVEMWEPEQTYRLMLLDLVAMVDAAAPHDLDRLDLVVAQRKKVGAPDRMSSKEQLLADVVERVKDGVEAGLAARGLVDRLDGGGCVVWKAAESWGLAASDVVANLTYNRRHRESHDVLERLRARGAYQDFEAFGAFDERRARVAERDGDLAMAVVRWAYLEESPERVEALDRIWVRARRRGTTGTGATLDSVVELLMRGPEGLGRARAFEAVEGSLVRTEAPAAVLYRLRDMMHLLANNRGDLGEASRLSALQESRDAELAADPTALPLVFKNLVHRLTTTELGLDFDGKLRAAQAYANAVQQYGVVTEMLKESTGVGAGSATATFQRSRLWIKAQSELARGLILVGTRECLAEAEAVLTALPLDAMADKDVTVAACYGVWAAVRAGDYDAALKRARALMAAAPESEFAQALGVRAAADAHVLGGEAVEGDVLSLLEFARGAATDKPRYPYDVLWRDVGVLESSLRGANAGARAFRLAREALKAAGGSPVTEWKDYGLRLSEAAARTPSGAVPSAPDGMDVGGTTAGEAAAAYRRASPY